MTERETALAKALLPFADFFNFIKAAEEIGDLEPLTDSTCVASLSAGGGSDYLWAVDLKRAAEALYLLTEDELEELVSN